MIENGDKMKITYYSNFNPRKLLNNTQFKTLADTVSIIGSSGETLELDAQQEQQFDNTIEVYRNLKLTGVFKATFELHNNVNVVIDSATITNGGTNQNGTIILADDFEGSLSIIDSKIKYTNDFGVNMAIWHASGDDTKFTQNLIIKNSTIDGLLDIPARLILQGVIELNSPNQEASSYLASANWQSTQATIKANYVYLTNNSAQTAVIKHIICQKGPVTIKGNWQFDKLSLDQKEPSESFKFGGDNRITNIKFKTFDKIKAPQDSNAFYSTSSTIDLTNSQLAKADDHLQATITDTKLIMKHTIDNFVWNLTGLNALDLDKASVTSLRQRTNEFAQKLPDKKNVVKEQSADKDSDDNTVNNDKSDPDKPKITANALAQNQVDKNAMAKLDAMIGLVEVKAKIKDYIRTAKYNVDAKKRGLPTAKSINRHMVFGGNPGTGKTTVAKYVAQILYEEGALATPNLKVATTKDLVAGYIGKTAEKTHKIVEDSLGGVLFIDEAYMLGDKNNSFNSEAVAQLLVDIDAHHEDLIVILAGYTKLMHQMFEINPGFRSRINNWIEFPDYSTKDKIAIFKKDCHDNGVLINQKLINTRTFHWLLKFYSRDHANGRSIRNLFEAITQIRINRVMPQMSKLTNEEIMTITGADLKIAYQDAIKIWKREKQERSNTNEVKKQSSNNSFR